MALPSGPFSADCRASSQKRAGKVKAGAYMPRVNQLKNMEKSRFIKL